MASNGTPGVTPVGGLSHVAGPTDQPLAELTIPEFLYRTAKQFPDRDAAIFCEAGERWSYDQLLRRVDRLAAGLLSLGLYKGDRVGIWGPNVHEWYLTQFAAAKAGLVLARKL